MKFPEWIGRAYAPDSGADGGEEGAVETQSAFEDGDDLDVVLVDQTPAKAKVEEPAVPVVESNPSLDAFAAQSKALTEGLAGIAEGLKKSAVPANVPQQQVGESDEDFYKRMEEESFQVGKWGHAIDQVITRKIAPIVNGFQTELLDAKKQLLAHDPELGGYYVRFKDEVEERVRATPRNQWHGEIYRQALKTIIAEKGPTLQQETIAEQVKKGIEEGLRAAGVDPAKPKSVPAPAMQALGGRASTVSAEPTVKSERLEVTQRDIEEMITRGIISSPKDVRKDSPYIEGIRVFISRKAKKG
jgi:hypothetical protein